MNRNHAAAKPAMIMRAGAGVLLKVQIAALALMAFTRRPRTAPCGR